MAHTFTVSPDFNPRHLSGWFIFNTWLQRQLGLPVHLQLYDDFPAQRHAIAADEVDLIYANPFDAAMLVREKRFVPLVRPAEHADEALIAVPGDSLHQRVEDLPPGARVASTEDPDVRMMGMIMLEPADLDAGNIERVPCDSYVLVAKALVRHQADAGIFLAEAFGDLSSLIRDQLRVLVSGQIQVVHHALLVGPRLADRREALLADLLEMSGQDKGRGVLRSLGISQWLAVDQEQMEFMIDLMDTLTP